MRKQGIDFHTHPVLVREMVERYPSLTEAARKLYYIGNNLQPLETFHLEMDLAGIEKAVILPMDRAASGGDPCWTNEQIAELCRLSNRLIGFATVDPRGNDPIGRLTAAVKTLGLRGLRLNPSIQGFFPDDRVAYPLYEAAQDLGVPILFEAGMNWEPGSRLQHGHPLRFEDIAADFPKLRIVLAHLAWPWITDAVALALKYPNVYLDTSALYFDDPSDFLRFAMTHQVPLTVFERSLRKQLVFGSSYPRVEIKNMAAAIDRLGFSEDCLNLIFRTNAETLLTGAR